MHSSAITGYKLSPIQQHIWKQQATGNVLPAQCTMRLHGALQIEALRAALLAIADTHEIFRTTFEQTPGAKQPLQVVKNKGAVSWQQVDLSGLSLTEKETAIAQFRESERCQWHLERLPLLRALLVKLNREAERKHWLLLTLPALCADSKTYEILCGELCQHYGQGTLRTQEVQYVQFAEWQNQLLTETDAEAIAARSFWQQDFSPLLLPPLRYRHFQQNSFTPQVRRFSLDADLAQALVRSESLETLLLTSWLVLLWRYAGKSAFTIGVYCDGRQEELTLTCGPITRSLPLSIQLESSTPFSALLRQVEMKQRTLAAWQDYVPNDLLPPSLPVGFEFIARPKALTVNGVRFELTERDIYPDRSELRLTAIQERQGVSVALHYDEAWIDAKVIAEWEQQLPDLLRSVIANPIAAIAQLNAPQRRGQNQCFIPPEDCIHHRFERQAALTPDRVALVVEEQQLTYRELNHRANQLAHSLKQLGAAPEVPVALYLEHSPELLVALLAVLKAGSAYLPLEPALPLDGVNFRLRDAQVPLLVTQKSLFREEFVPLTALVLDGEAAPNIAQQPETNPTAAVTPDNLAYLIYTSGSTGQPKGVAVAHCQLLSYLDSIVERCQLPAAAHYGVVSTLAADLGHTTLFASLCRGGTLHLIAPERAADAQAFSATCRQQPLDCLKIVPSHLQALLNCPDSQAILPCQCLILGGETCHWSLVEQIRDSAPYCRIFNHYGPTETTVGAIAGALEWEALDSKIAVTVPLGRALAHTQIWVLDEHLHPVSMGVPGEIYLGGAGVARGYWQRPSLTAQRFIPNPFADVPGDRLYRTGDWARTLPNGTIEFLRRTDLQVKLHGFRLELGEIEAHLGRHPDLQQAVVQLRKNDSNHPQLVAYIVPTEGNGEQATSTSALREFLQQFLPTYAIPNHFVFLSTLPLTPNGKVNRQTLPAPEIRVEASEYLAPQSPTEEAIAAIWSQLLGVEKVGVGDNFFELGGHSLLATQVLSRLHETFAVELPLRQVFEAHTVAEMAAVVEAAVLAEIEALSDEEAQNLMENGHE
ncbi:MAG: amino acid adenylation domain-containing protein [Cyanophyceae cyanobacterium]